MNFICTCCGEEKPLDEARKRRGRPPRQCNSCRNKSETKRYSEFPDKFTGRKNKYRNKHWIRTYISSVALISKNKSIKKNLPYNIDVPYLRGLMEQQGEKCVLSGLPFERSPTPGTKHAMSPSLDRIEPSLGYVVGNVRFICDGLNSAKSTGTDEQLLALCRAVVEKNA